MIHALLVSRENSVFTELETAFSEEKITAEWTDTGKNALSMLSEKKFDLVITHEQLPDMTGRDFIEKVVLNNPMIHCVALSALSHEDFHETHEGLGVLMQFPLTPGRKQAQNLLDHLNRIAGIAGGTPRSKGD